MKKRKVNKWNVLFHILVVINILLALGMVVMYYENQKPEKAVLTDEFDEELAEAREFLAGLNEEPLFIMLKEDFPEVYENWNMVTKMESKFGYNEDLWGISIVVGTHDGTEIREAHFKGAHNAQVVKVTGLFAEANNMLVENANKYEETKYFTFQINDVKYLVDNNLNVWKVG